MLLKNDKYRITERNVKMKKQKKITGVGDDYVDEVEKRNVKKLYEQKLTLHKLGLAEALKKSGKKMGYSSLPKLKGQKKV